MVKYNLTKANKALNTINTELDKLKVTMDRLYSLELSACVIDGDDLAMIHNIDSLVVDIVEKLSDLHII